jgi:hypothetical protein
VRIIGGRSAVSYLPCRITNKQPNKKFSKEAKCGVQVLNAFCFVSLEDFKHICRILTYEYMVGNKVQEKENAVTTRPHMLFSVVFEQASLTTV